MNPRKARLCLCLLLFLAQLHVGSQLSPPAFFHGYLCPAVPFRAQLGQSSASLKRLSHSLRSSMILLYRKQDDGVALEIVHLLSLKLNPSVCNYDCNVFLRCPLCFLPFFFLIKIALGGNCFPAQYSRQRSKF